MPFIVPITFYQKSQPIKFNEKIISRRVSSARRKTFVLIRPGNVALTGNPRSANRKLLETMANWELQAVEREKHPDQRAGGKGDEVNPRRPKKGTSPE